MALKLGSNVKLDKVVKGLGQKHKLSPHLDLSIGEGEFDWHFDYTPKLGDDAWHPSGDCTPSLRELYLKAKGESQPKPISMALRKTFMVGHFWHQYLQWIVQHRLQFAGEDAIERRGVVGWGKRCGPGDTGYAGNEGWQPYHWATGSGDIAPCVIPGHGEFAIDFKTMNARMFAAGPTPDYLARWECQGNIYLDFFGLDRLIFVGICKDSPHAMREWEFERNQPLIDAIYGKWKLVSACLDEDIEPPKDEKIALPLKGPSAA